MNLNIFERINSFFSHLDWVYNTQHPMIYGVLDNLFQLINVLLVFWALKYAAGQYRLLKNEKADRERPFVYLDLEFDSILCTLVIRNTGGSPAKDIFINFVPEIIIHNENINTLPVFNGLPFLAPNKDIKMFIGSMLGESNIKKSYTVKLEYKDMWDKKYKEMQIVDPSKHVGVSRIVRKGLHDIAKSVEDIAKSQDRTQRYLETLTKVIKNGINIRNQDLQSYSYKDLLKLLKRTYELSDKDRLELYPDVNDLQILLKHTKGKILSKGRLSIKDKDILVLINKIQTYQFYSGYGDEYKNIWNELIKSL
jgi:hypothetical protein